jgi:YesN/AraC family two-component response regulator
MDGLKVSRYIMERYPMASILICSAYDSFSLISEALEIGVKGYLLKPITKERLAEEVEYALTGRPAVKKPAHIVARTFGEFDLQVDGKSVAFSRKRAKELLRSIHYRIEEVAQKVGYKNYASFYRAFVREFNMTPMEYRYSLSKDAPNEEADHEGS